MLQQAYKAVNVNPHDKLMVHFLTLWDTVLMDMVVQMLMYVQELGWYEGSARSPKVAFVDLIH